MEHDFKEMFRLLSNKGIDNVNLEMLPFDQKKQIYEKYAELFVNEKGKDATYIVVKAYSKANNKNKVQERLVNELKENVKEKKFKYSYYLALLLKDDEMIKFLEQFKDDGVDKSINFDYFYTELKAEMEAKHDKL